MKIPPLHILLITIVLIASGVLMFTYISKNQKSPLAIIMPSPAEVLTKESPTPIYLAKPANSAGTAGPSNTPTPTSTPTPSPTPTNTPTPSPKPVAHFLTLPPGSVLPSGETCAARIRRSNWEPRPENNGPNHTVPVAGRDYAIIDWGPNSFGQNERANTLRARINGNFTGTTDEILQWAACKWGIDEDIVRAQAVQESYWRMSQRGDGDQSVGILQVKVSVHRNTDPAAKISTAFNADYTYAFWRSCYEGYIDWLHAEHPEYNAGDVWGCLGHWASGGWNNEDANKYINNVKGHLNSHRWQQSDF